ncbi:MAG: HAD-IC family P-type ATPase [Patescibacteria group bacterium]
MNYYTLGAEKTIEKLNTSLKNGLSSKEAINRLAKYGANLLPHEKPISIKDIVLAQILDPLIMILIIGAAITLITYHYQDFYIIAVVIIFELVIGFIEEYRSEKIVEKLIKISQTKAKVVRDGKLIHIISDELVPGDIIEVNIGEKIPADARVISTEYFSVNEAVLTGESALVEKKVEPVDVDTPIMGRSNMIFQGTFASNGSAIAVVTTTGRQTEFGKISIQLQAIKKNKTPLQKKLAEFSKFIALIVISAAIIFSLISLFIGKNIVDVFLLATSISVSAIPESFPIIVAIALVVGVARLAKKKVIVKHLPAVETLGSTSIIGMDKTGTLTENKLSVKKIVFPDDQEFEIDTQDYSPTGNFILDGKKIKPIDFPHLELLLTAGALCNDSSIKKNKDETWIALGDPTEAALVAAAAKAELGPDELNEKCTREQTIAFRSETNYMATINYCQSSDKKYIFLKGSPEVLLEKCSYQTRGDKTVKLNNKEKKDLINKANELANKSYRLLSIAYKEIPTQGEYQLNETNLKYGLIYAGLVAMVDPIRHTAAESLKLAKKAGLKVLIITGDHPNTAINIAKSLGLKIEEKNVITGRELSDISEQDFIRKAEEIIIYARVLPEQKLKIIEFWQNKGHVVAMTGDGINDAPALKKADIGISMGTGTDVAKEAAEIILLENDFYRIVETIKQGRIIYDNIKKTVIYLLGHNLGEIGVIFLSIVFRFPLPLIPTQILWMNLVTDGVIDEALVFEPGENNIMNKPPRSSQERFIDPLMIRRILLIGIYMALISFLAFWYYLTKTNLDYARTITFVLMGFFSIFGVYSSRSITTPTLKVNIWQNQFIIYGVLISIILQMIVVYLPPLNNIFHTIPLNMYDLFLIILLSFSLLVVVEIHKMIERTIESRKKSLA